MGDSFILRSKVDYDKGIYSNSILSYVLWYRVESTNRQNKGHISIFLGVIAVKKGLMQPVMVAVQYRMNSKTYWHVSPLHQPHYSI